jgi:hypothetical protein
MTPYANVTRKITERKAKSNMRNCSAFLADSPASAAVTMTSSVTSVETRVTSLSTPLLTMPPL